MAGCENQTGLILLRDLARQFNPVTELKFRIAIVIEGQCRQLVLEVEIGIEKEWVLINDFALVTAL